MFFCPNCQNPILKYQGGLASAIVPGDADENPESERIMKFPIIIFCKNSNDQFGPCGAVYIFEGWAT